jgi:hypothetical protein
MSSLTTIPSTIFAMHQLSVLILLLTDTACRVPTTFDPFSIKISFPCSPHCLLIPFSVHSTPVGTRHAVSVMHAAPIIGIDFIIDEDVSKFNF